METINFSFISGYFDAASVVATPENSLMPGSVNVHFNKIGRPLSIKSPLKIGHTNHGGSKAYPLTDTLIGFLGNNNTSEKGTGNILQISNGDLWFVGSNVANGVRVSDNFSTFRNIGGTHQIEDLALVLNDTASAGTFDVRVFGTYIADHHIDVTVTLNGGETEFEIALKLRDKLRDTPEIESQYFITATEDKVRLTDKKLRDNDDNLSLTVRPNSVNLDELDSSSIQAGTLNQSANLSVVPQRAKFDGTNWCNPTQVGVPELDIEPQLVLTTSATKSANFTGKIVGSISCKAALKREGTIGIASPSSNVVTGDNNSVYVYVPPYPEDGSLYTDREIVLYFTYTGRGSQASHLMFPIFIPETKLDGKEANGWEVSKGNARIKVISQHPADINQRIVEVEFLNNDLLILDTFDDYFQASPCKFISQLGNVVCLIGSDDDRRGFDVSYPDNRQAFPVDWRDWLRDEPISIADGSEQGFIWILGSYSVTQAIWTGATQQTAPVVLKEITTKYGAIGESASVSVDGFLYFLSRGKTAVRVSPSGELDILFGAKVQNYLKDFTSDTVLGYHEDTNTVYFICNNSMIGYCVDLDIWTSPIDTLPNPVITLPAVESAFSLNGKMHYCSFEEEPTSSYSTYRLDSGSVDNNWIYKSNFKFGSRGFNLKDIIEIRAIIESDVADTYTFQALKNFKSAGSPINLFSYTSTPDTQVTVRRLLESRDYETISMIVHGNKAGQTVHNIMCTVDNRGIERGK